MIALIFWVILDCSLGLITINLAHAARMTYKKYGDSDYISLTICSVLLGLLTIVCIIAPFCK